MKTYFAYVELEYDNLTPDVAHRLREKGFEVSVDNEGWVVTGKGRDGDRVVNRIRKAVSAIVPDANPYSWGYWRI